MNKKIFSDLKQENVIQLEKLLARIFTDIDAIATRKSFLLNAGIDEYFIISMDFNLNINEFTTNLVAKLKNYSVSSRKPDYHPLIALLKYILHQPERFNLDDTEIEWCQQIISIEQQNNNQVNQTSSGNNTTNSSSVQVGKFNTNINEGKDIHIGDRTYYSGSEKLVDKAISNESNNSDELSIFIQQLKYARLEGEEGDRNTGSFYTYKVWLEDISQQKSTSNKDNKQYTIKGKWCSQVYKEVNLFGLRIDYPWGKKKKPYGKFLIVIEVLNGEIKSRIKVDRHDDSPNNYAANKVEKMLNDKINDLTVL